MKQLVIVALCVLSIFRSSAQKLLVDSNTYNKWKFAGSGAISNNGRYVIYDSEIPRSSGSIQSVEYVVKSIEGKWRFGIRNAKGFPRFTSNSRYCIYGIGQDSLAVLDLKKKRIKYLSNILIFRLPEKDIGKYLYYQSTTDKDKLVIFDIETGKSKKTSNVESYDLSDNGMELVLKLKTNGRHSLTWINLKKDTIINVKTNKEIDDIVLDFKNHQLAFKSQNCIYYYKFGMAMPMCLINNFTPGIQKKLCLGSLDRFSKDGQRLFFYLDEKEVRRVKSVKNEVEIWSYMDVKLQSQQEEDLDKNYSYLAVVPVRNPKVIQLQMFRDEDIHTWRNEAWIISESKPRNGDGNDWNWNSASISEFALVSIIDGSRINLAFLKHRVFPGELWLTPDEKSILYYDTDSKKYFSYNIISGKIFDLSNGVNGSFATKFENRGVAGWMAGEQSVLVYDQNDIWMLALDGRKKAVNLTNGYGVRNKIIFYLALVNEENYQNSPIVTGKRLILNAFNTTTKDNGFFAMTVDNNVNPTLLSMESAVYKVTSEDLHGETGSNPIKARGADMYLVKRMSPTDAPNFFITSDFRNFKRLSNIQPQSLYNWYFTELHTWNSLDGRKLQGILYKPNNFDPKKKYPVIFYYYERLSDGLNAFLKPDFSRGSIDIPTYVSNGYLVFSPDIYYKQGDPMQGTYDAVISAAKYISCLPYVNQAKIGLNGHSFGGIQTYYLITKTHIFAAACSGSGMTDWISQYAGLSVKSPGFLDFEIGQLRMGSMLWENLEGYLNNSAVLNAIKVTTPILMVHGKKENSTTSFANVMEFYNSLRRLGKRTWLLAYPQGGHVLMGKDAADVDIRMRQFFDHYLKDKLAPLWMTRGIAASRREVDSGLELDSVINTPGPGLLTVKEQKKIDSLITKKSVTVTLK